MIELDVLDSSLADQKPSKYRFWRHPAQRDAAASDATSDATSDTEFGDGASEPPSGASRRQFLQLMGAAMAMAGLTGCRRPAEKILPYARKPEDVIPGVPQQYATAMPFRGIVRPLLVKSNEGRPTKVDGNADHPMGQSGTSSYEQASVLNLYDPDRSRVIRRDGNEATWSDFQSFCQQLADDAAQTRLAVLVPETSSPTMLAMRERLQSRFPDLRWVTYSPDGDDVQTLGMQQAFGRPLRPQYALDDADVILSLDADFLAGTARNFQHNTQTFAEGRRLEGPEDTMSRLYAVESQFSTTGGVADNRLRMKASRIGAFAATVAATLGVGSAPSVQWSEKEELYAREIARDLEAAGPNAVVLAGDTQPPEVHALAMAINQQLGSVGETVTLLETGGDAAVPQDESLRGLVDDMKAGNVDALFMLGVNPVYNAPADLGMSDALAQVDETVHVGLLNDETAQASRWHIPQTHYLETWSDGRAYDGTLSIIQPLIAPLYNAAHSDIEVLNLLATGIDASGYDLVREQWRGVIDGTFEAGWRQALHDGYLAESAFAEASVGAATVPSMDAPQDEGIEIVVRPDPKVLDGRFSNNAWMQELPDPVTKIVWDNVAIMSEATATELGAAVDYSEGNFYADRVTLEVNGQSVELPVWIQPGHPDGSISVTMGYGRNIATTRPERSAPFWDTAEHTDIYGSGPIASGVGQNVAPLKPVGGRVVQNASVTSISDDYLIASTQEEGDMQGRPIIRWATLDEFKDDPYFVDDVQEQLPAFAHHGDHGGGHGDGHGAADHSGDGAPAHSGDGASHDDGHGGDHSGDGAERVEGFREYPPMWDERHPKDSKAYKDNPYYDNQWGMVIDLNTCMGCNACVVACTSENNVQVVGKEEVSNGRHMYWLRMDRYYVTEEGNEDEPEMLTQPVMCQHCENAPCEQVCPVAATVHSPDGTNQMIYNRCIGTRYCSNNCPYKVRRFNFYNWTKTLPTEVQMAQNPEVSVRFRGVMEKCSWCIHRVRDHQRQADNENRDLRPNEIETACQQACPTNAITFGDLNNEDSDVVQKKQNPRRYELLAYLNVKPRLSYLGRVRNPNPRLADASPA